jgi:outer membrane protein W
MKKIFTLAALTILLGAAALEQASAQISYAGFKLAAAVGVPRVKAGTAVGSVGYTAGVWFTSKLADHLVFAPEINYLYQEYEVDATLKARPASSLFYKAQVNHITHIINVPLMVRYTFLDGKGFTPFVGIGPMANFIFYQEQEAKEPLTGKTVGDNDEINVNMVGRLGASAAAETGFLYNWPKVAFSFNVRYAYGLTDNLSVSPDAFLDQLFIGFGVGIPVGSGSSSSRQDLLRMYKLAK